MYLDLIGQKLGILNNKRGDVKLELKRSGVLNVFVGTAGGEMALDSYLLFTSHGILPRLHIVDTDGSTLPYEIPKTPLDNNGGGKVYHIFKPIVRANHDALLAALSKYDEIFALQLGTVMGATGSNSDSYARINRECGRSVLTVLSMREGERTTNEIENIQGNVRGFLEVREEWGGVMEVFKSASKETARFELDNFAFTLNNACVQKTCNPRDLNSVVDKYPFGTLLTLHVKSTPNTNPNQIYDKALSGIKVLKKKGLPIAEPVELIIFIHAPPDLLQFKDTIAGYLKQAFISSDIAVKGNFEPFLSYDHLITRRDLWVHVIVPTDMEEYCKRL